MISSNTNRTIGPNVKKLICHKMARDAIPDGSVGFAAGVSFLSNPELIKATAKEATEWVFVAIDAVRSAPNCEWTTDEEIAGEILKKIGKNK